MKVKFLQEGGPMPAEDPAMAGGAAPAEPGAAPGGEAPQGGEEEAMMQQLMQMAQEIVQQMGPEAAMMLAQAIMEIAQGGGEAPMPAPEEQPVYKIGGILVQRGRR